MDRRGFVAGHGTTAERSDYAFDVDVLTPGRHTFRLRQSDTDGTVHLSAETTVEIGSDGPLSLRVLANGSRAPRVAVSGLAQESGAELRVYDVLGRSVQTVAVTGAGVVELSAMASGAYVVRLVSDGREATARLVVRR